MPLCILYILWRVGGVIPVTVHADSLKNSSTQYHSIVYKYNIVVKYNNFAPLKLKLKHDTKTSSTSVAVMHSSTKQLKTAKSSMLHG